MMLPNYSEGDILIKRVSNGWIAISSSEYSDGHLEACVYEDPAEPNFMEKSLAVLIKDQFNVFMQSKRKAGIKLEVTEESIEEEDAKSTSH